jgi:tRNA(fMet)-specific endonuclease VapC
MKRLLDTNAYVALKRGHEGVASIVHASSSLTFSTIVIGELLFGFRNGNRLAKNTAELDELLADARVEVLDVSAITADRFGRIAASLRKIRQADSEQRYLDCRTRVRERSRARHVRRTLRGDSRARLDAARLMLR